jgi:hypothetical protein
MGKLVRNAVVACFAFLTTVALSGCSSMVYQQALSAIRRPGEHVRTSPDQVWNDLKCAERERPFVWFESLEIVPNLIKPGYRTNYRIVYVMCPLGPSEVIKTRVGRRILFKGEEVANNVNDAFELKPGRWVVDSFFTLPRESPLGVYSLEVSFETSNRKAHKKVGSFVVSNDYLLLGE